MILDSEIKQIISDYKYHKSERGTWESYWQDCANYALPRKAWVSTQKSMGMELNFNHLYDSRAILAVKKSAAGFHSNLTNPSSKWFQMGTLEEKWMQSGSVQKYFKECDDIQYAHMNKSNFNRAMMEFYPNLLVFGVSTILTEQSEKYKVRYTPIPVEQSIIEEDAEGDVCATYRPFKLTAIQCKMRWGNNLPENILKALESGNFYAKFDILHHVCKRDRRDVRKRDNINMAYRSTWIAIKDEFMLEESGFMEDPYATARWWKDTQGNDPYAYGPVMDVLSSIKLVNAEKRTLIRVAMKQSDPAMASPYKFWIAPLNLNPSAMNYYDASKFRLDQFQEIKNNGNIPVTVEIMKLEQDLIDAGLYVNLFENLMNVTKQMTVPEVQKRVAEALALISPVIGHVLDEGITPILLRTHAILHRQNVFPPPPKEVQGRDMDITYLSPLAKAQRSSEMNGLNAWTEYVKGLSEIFPDAKYIVNVDKVGRTSADLFGVDPSNVTEQKDIDKRREGDQQMQQQQMQIQQAAESAKIAVSQTKAQKNSADAQKK